MRYKLTLSYDGSDFFGFQVQDDLRTVEKEIVNALKIMTDQDVKIYASGRTDRYVHARGQVIHFDIPNDIPPNRFKKAINNILPHDIYVINVEYAKEDFHARFSALSKEYRYYISLGEVDPFKSRYISYYNNLDINLMDDAIKLFIGKHDFKGFASSQIDERKDTIKEVFEAKINKLNDFEYEFVFVGTGFLKYQIRRMMGALIEIGRGKEDKSLITKVLELKDPKICHKVADGAGLYLHKVNY